jgi:O-antigen ligase
MFTAWGGVTALTSDFAPLVVDATILFAKILIIYLMAVNALRTRRQIRLFFVFMLAWYLFYPTRGAYLNYFVFDYTTFGRAMWAYQYENPNDLAAFTIIQMSVAGSLILMGGARWIRGLGLISIPAFFFLIILTQSRGAFLAVLAGAAFVVGTGRKKTRMVLMFAAVGVLVFAMAPESVWERFGRLATVTSVEDIDQLDSEASAEGRWDIWTVAATIIADRPITGVGLGVYRLAHEQYSQLADVNPLVKKAMDTHSTYLRTTAETGFPGLFLFLGMVASVLLYAERIRRQCKTERPQDMAILTVLMAGLIGYLMAGIFGSYTEQVMTYMHMATVWAFAALCERELRHAPAAGTRVGSRRFKAPRTAPANAFPVMPPVMPPAPNARPTLR